MDRKNDPDLSHLDSSGAAGMVDVGSKEVTKREAVAVARVRMRAETLDLVARHALPKGDVLTVARVAGILAAKATPQLIPMTHPLPLTFIDVACTVDREASEIVIRSTVRCEAKTGAEIEAMTACAVAALTIYDMCKSAEKGIVISGIALEEKSGGKSGHWKRDQG